MLLKLRYQFNYSQAVPRGLGLALIVFVLTAVSAGAFEKLEIRDADLDTNYLPYTLQEIRVETIGPDAGRIRNPWQVISPSVAGSNEGRYFTSYNTSPAKDRPAILGLHSFPVVEQIYDTPFYLTIRDWQVFQSAGGEAEGLVIVGFRNDSAFVVRMDLNTGEKSELYLCNGTDDVYDGVWEPEIEVALVEDYDYDQSQEALIWVNSVRECSVRVLHCVNLEPLEIEWSLPVASLVSRETTFSCRDSLNPAIILTVYNPRQGYADKNFSDMYSYLTKIDRHGQIVFNRKLAVHHLFCRIARSESDGEFYLYHAMDLRADDTVEDTAGGGYYISKIDRDGNLLRTTHTRERPRHLWRHQYGPSSEPAVYLEFQEGFHRVYDSNLGLVAQSDSVGHLGFLGRIKMAGFEDSVLVFSDGIYSAELTKLADFAGSPSFFQVIGQDEAGNATSLIVNSDGARILNIIKRNVLVHALTVFYIWNQKLILMIMSGLIASILVMNVYRRRVKADLRVIVDQRDELSRTHQALTEAQERIIEQEKFRQAKSIAGGFAHEIRNALFPAEAAYSNLKRTGSGSAADPELIEEAARAVKRAIDITELISRYTKLDAEHVSEPVNLRELIEDVLKTNHLQIERQGVELSLTCDADVVVQSNQQQLHIVLTNLLLNSLDALTGTPQPRILLAVETDNGIAGLVIEDNGTGISPDDLPRIFDAFFSTKPSTGTGLGLATSKKIIESYGGSIQADSSPQEWTRFEVRMTLIS